jgi:hypothetical protein
MNGTISGQFLDNSPGRVRTLLNIPFKQIGTVKPRNVSEIKSSNWTIGCEVLDRDYTNYDAYKEYLPYLGIKKIRLMAGWAKTEKQKGVYDFAWLDHIINDALSRGLKIWLETSYGNPIYEGGGGYDLGAGFPVSDEAKAAWDRWVTALVTRYKDRVTEWEMWNEPDRWGGESVAEINIRTAEIIKKIQPEAEIAGLVMASGSNTKLLDDYLQVHSERGKLDLYKWIVYHGYSMNPDAHYKGVENLRKVLASYSSTLKLRQGENGAPSGYCPGFALSKYYWTEITQAKWDTRRMLGDLGRDTESSVFCIIDMYYKRQGEVPTLNIKGLIQSDTSMRALRPKIAFYSVQNVASVFDNRLERIREFKFNITSPRSVSVFGYENVNSKMQTVSLWFDDGIPVNHFDTRNIDITIENGNFRKPVWVDIFSGRVYEIPKSNRTKTGNTYKFTGIPMYDSPVLISDKSNIIMQQVKKVLGNE